MRNWLILVSYFMASFCNGLAMISLVSIPSKAMSYYSISSFELSLYALIFELISLPLAPISIWIIQKSFYASLHIVWALTLTGVWIRVVASDNYWIAFAGQTLIASDNILILCSCSNLASLWFPPHHHILATSFATAANFAGMGFAFLFMPYHEDIELMMWIQAGIASVFFVFNLIVLRKSIKVENNIGFVDSLWVALKDTKLMVMAGCAGSGLGVSYAIVSTFGLLLEDYGYSDIDIGWTGFLFLLSGLGGGLVATYLAEVKNSVKVPLEYFLVFNVIVSLAFAGIAEFDYYSFLFAGLYGAAIIGILPLSIRICVNYIPEIDESIPTNKVYFFGQIFGTIYTYPIQYSQEVIGISGLWMAGAIIAMSFVIYLWQVNSLSKDKTEAKPSLSKQEDKDNSAQPLLNEDEV